MTRISLASLSLIAMICSGCSPTVMVETPNEPITINFNVKIDHEIVVKVDKALDNVFKEDADIF